MFLRLTLLSAIAFVGPFCVAEDWYRWRGPRLDGVSSESNWQPSKIAAASTLAWKANVGIGFSSVVTSEGLLYTMGNGDDTDTIYALDTRTGKVAWTMQYESPLDDREFEGGPTSTPTVDEGRLYALGRNGDLHCLDKKNGKQLWKHNVADFAEIRIPGWGFSASPLVVGDRLIINAGDAGIAFDKVSGKLLWKSADKDCGYGSPVPTKDAAAIIIPSGRSYVAVNLEDGRELWRQKWLTTFGCNAADPILIGDRVFLCSGYNRGCGLLEIKSGTPKFIWKNKLMQNQISTSILIRDHLYGISGDIDRGTSLMCIGVETGELMWQDDELNPGAIAACGDRLLIMTTTGELVIAGTSPRKLDVIADRKVLKGKCWTTPVISNGMIYGRSADGELVALDVN